MAMFHRCDKCHQEVAVPRVVEIKPHEEDFSKVYDFCATCYQKLLDAIRPNQE